MTVIFPNIDDENLLPFLAPFSRMMFGYGRAMVALREVAIMVLGDEDKAVRFMLKVKSNTMVEKFRDLCAPTFEPDRLDALLGHIATLTDLYRRRNMIVHGEWWFNVFEGGELQVRDLDREEGGPIHDETVTPESLDMLAREFDEVSSDIDMFSYRPNAG
jgi:hypothetical protein